MADNQSSGNTTKDKISLSLSPRLVILILLAVIAGMLALWRPWSPVASSGQTIEVTGSSKITDKPDEFVFYPSYEFKNADKDSALSELTKKSDAIVSKLKELGVADSKIKTNSSGYDYPVYYGMDNKDATYSLQLTVTVDNLDLAQKVQDYLVTTAPTGAVSPQSDFSDQKRKTLESKARDEATKDARTKADQSAKNLGFKVGKVKSVTDGTGFDIPCRGGLCAGTTLDSAAAAKPSLAVQPGENDLNYSVTVVYYIK